MFSLNLVDYPMFSLLLSTWNDLGHLPDTQLWVGGGGWWWWWVVAHKILVTSPEAKFLFSLFGALGFGLGLGLGLVN